MRVLTWTKALASSCFVSSPLVRKQRNPFLLESKSTSIDSAGAPADDDDDQGETLRSLTSKVEAALLFVEEENSNNNNNNPSLQVLTSRLSNLSLNRTYVGSSNIAGRGLFAAIDCPKGTLLTCYPGDGLVDDDGDEIYWSDHLDLLNDDDDDDDTTANFDEYSYEDYLMYLTDEIGLIGSRKLDQDPAYLGHFANDGAVTNIPQSGVSMEDILTKTLAYLEESQTKANVKEQDILNGCHMALVASRDISKNEEIFLCYGPDYWWRRES